MTIEELAKKNAETKQDKQDKQYTSPDDKRMMEAYKSSQK